MRCLQLPLTSGEAPAHPTRWRSISWWVSSIPQRYGASILFAQVALLEILRRRCAVNVLSPLSAILQHDGPAQQQSDDDGDDKVRDNQAVFACEVEPTACYTSANDVVGYGNARCGGTRPEYSGTGKFVFGEVLHCTVYYPKHYGSWTRISMYLDHCRSLLSPLIDPMMQESERHLS